MGTKRGTNGAAVNEGMKVNGSLPLYADPKAINSVTHRDVTVKVGPGDYAFAANAPMIQITVDEFERAALDYPIVFFGEDRQPYIVDGLELDRNLFVNEGQYRVGAYIPAYLRRYPFVFARDEGSEALILCLDHASDRVATKAEDGAQPLFSGEEPTELTRQALQFCESYEFANNRTRAFVALAEELGLFTSRQAHYTAVGASEPTLLLDYLTIDREKLDLLGSDDVQKLRDVGALAAAYAVTTSQAQWEVFPLLAA